MTGNLSCCSNSAVRAPPGREPPRVSISGSLQKMEDIAHELDADSDDQQRQRSARHVWRSSRTESGSLDSPESEEYAASFGLRRDLMRRMNVRVLLSAAILFLGTVITAQPAAFPEAFRVIGNIYWVGGEYGSYLITTPQGHILLDTGSTEMHDVIVSNVKKLGFKVEDIKIMISSHAHWDHVQGHAAMKKLTGAQVVALGGDAAALEAGQDNSAGGFPGMIAVH